MLIMSADTTASAVMVPPSRLLVVWALVAPMAEPPPPPPEVAVPSVAASPLSAWRLIPGAAYSPFSAVG
ncbi:hypothetical protein D3C83_139820 [compost metagenome]